MSKTKIEHVTKAFNYLRISGLTSIPTSNETVDALTELEDMMHQFKSRNICSSYNFEDVIDPNTDSNIDSAYNEATALCLAQRLAPSYGKMLSPELKALVTSGLSNWSARSGKVNQIAPSRRQPRGSGNTFRFQNLARYYRFENNAPISCSTLDLKVDEIDFFIIDFSYYIKDPETISSYTITSSDGVEVITNTQDGNQITLECKGLIRGYQTVTITLTTSLGRVNPEIINFNIT